MEIASSDFLILSVLLWIVFCDFFAEYAMQTKFSSGFGKPGNKWLIAYRALSYTLVFLISGTPLVLMGVFKSLNLWIVYAITCGFVKFCLRMLFFNQINKAAKKKDSKYFWMLVGIFNTISIYFLNTFMILLLWMAQDEKSRDCICEPERYSAEVSRSTRFG